MLDSDGNESEQEIKSPDFPQKTSTAVKSATKAAYTAAKQLDLFVVALSVTKMDVVTVSNTQDGEPEVTREPVSLEDQIANA